MDRVLDSVVKARRIDCTCVPAKGLAHLLDELQILVAVKGECGSTAEDCLFGIGHFRQLLSSEVVAIEGDDRRDVRLAGRFRRRVGRLLMEAGAVEAIHALGN